MWLCHHYPYPLTVSSQPPPSDYCHHYLHPLTVSSLPPPSDCVITTSTLWLCHHYPHPLTVSSLPLPSDCVVTIPTLWLYCVCTTLWLCHHHPPFNCDITIPPSAVSSLPLPSDCVITTYGVSIFMYTSSINIILYSSCYISGLYINGRGVMVTL